MWTDDGDDDDDDDAAHRNVLRVAGGAEAPGSSRVTAAPLSLSAEDLIMAAHKASSRRVEVLSRTTGNVDQVCLYVCCMCACLFVCVKA